jgi:hypothetical protein
MVRRSRRSDRGPSRRGAHYGGPMNLPSGLFPSVRYPTLQTVGQCDFFRFPGLCSPAAAAEIRFGVGPSPRKVFSHDLATHRHSHFVR